MSARRHVLLALACASLALQPSVASAFAVPASFPLPTTEAGGGGRFFTGSPSDGFTCKVCHRGGTPSPIRVLGLPLTGYKLGKAYEVTIDWPNDVPHVGLNVEITDDSGVAAGTLNLPPKNELLPTELCNDGSNQSASELHTPINRIVVSVRSSCQSKQVRFLWTAPPDDRGAVRITGSVVAGDDSDTNEGDGVTEIARIIASRSDRDASASHISGCSVALPDAAGGGAAGGFGLGVLALWSWRRRR